MILTVQGCTSGAPPTAVFLIELHIAVACMNMQSMKKNGPTWMRKDASVANVQSNLTVQMHIFQSFGSDRKWQHDLHCLRSCHIFRDFQLSRCRLLNPNQEESRQLFYLSSRYIFSFHIVVICYRPHGFFHSVRRTELAVVSKFCQRTYVDRR